MIDYDEMLEAKRRHEARREFVAAIFDRQIGKAWGDVLAAAAPKGIDFRHQGSPWQPHLDGGKGLLRWIAPAWRQSHEAMLNGLRYNVARKSFDGDALRDHRHLLIDVLNEMEQLMQDFDLARDEQAIASALEALGGWFLRAYQD